MSDPRSDLRDADAERAGTRAPLAAISTEMVRIYRSHFGRGPTQTRTDWAGPDTVVVILEGTLTPSERKFAELGEHQRLREARILLQHLAIDEFCAPVEHATGRKVRAFLSSIDVEAGGVATETFVLHPDGYTGPSRAEVAGRP